MQKQTSPLKIQLPSQPSTELVAAVAARCVVDRAIFALLGPMGAGKTTFVQSVARGLGVKELVSSPTFTMMNEYHSGRLPLYHLDLYRLSEDADSMRSLLETELDEIIDSKAIVMIEWADLLVAEVDRNSHSKNFFDQLDYVVAKLSYSDEVKPSEDEAKKISSFCMETGRCIELTAFGERSALLIHNMRSELGDMVINS